MVRPECQHFLEEMESIRAEIIDLEKDRQAAPPGMKGNITLAIGKKKAELDRLQNAFNECEGVPQLPDPIAAVFPCTVSISTNNTAFPALGPASATATMTFSQEDYKQVLFTFPATPISSFTVTFLGIGVYTNVITASLSPSNAGGSFERSTGHVDIPQANFYMDNSQWFIPDSTLQFAPLTTRSVPSSLPFVGSLTGAPLSRTNSLGRLVLVGSSALSGGYYGGTIVDIIMDGILSQFPPP